MPRLALLLGLTFLAAIVAISTPASGHGMRTAYVEIVERPGGLVSARITTGSTWGAVRLVMPPGCAPGESESPTWSCAGGLAGSEIQVDGLGGVVGEAVVVVELADHTRSSQLLRPGAARWTIPIRSTFVMSFGRYLRSGFLHVLAGADHLLFLAALVVALRRWRAVVLAETAFTVSHSVAFSAAALGWIQVPAAAAEAAIALSLVLLALDIGKRPVGARSGATSAFVFGAVHGLGFAGGLTELGVPRDATTTALVGFAAGVELAQLTFLAACFAFVALATRFAQARRLAVLTAYAVGVTGTFWLVDRVVPLVGGAIHP